MGEVSISQVWQGPDNFINEFILIALGERLFPAQVKYTSETGEAEISQEKS